MSLTIVGRPDKFSPVYNPMFFYVDSTNKNEDGFKYIIDIYSGTTQSNKLARYKLFPRPVDGFGVGDINQLLTSQVGYYFNQDMNVITGSTGSFIDYNVQFGEEYVKFWTFTDNSYYGTAPYIGYTEFIGMASGQVFVAGDLVLVEQTSGYTSSIYNGIFTVLSAGPTSIIVDLIHSVSTPVNGGTIVYSDRRKTLYSGLNSETGYTAFNGVVSHQELMTYTSSTFNLATGGTAQFLTNLPDGYRVKTENEMWLNFYSINPSIDVRLFQLDTRYGQYFTVNTGTSTVQTIAIGPANITAVESDVNPAGSVYWGNDIGTWPVFKNTCWTYDYATSGPGVPATTILTNLSLVESPWYNNFNDEQVDFYVNGVLTQALIQGTSAANSITLAYDYTAFTNTSIVSGEVFQKTEYYDITTLQSGTTSATSETLRINVDYNTTRYGNIELIFIDRLGSFIPVNFELQSAKSINIDRNEYQTFLGQLSGGKWGFNSTDRGRQVLNTTVKTQLELNSNWLTQSEADYMQELYTSPVVFIKEYGKLWPVIIKTNSYDIKTKNNKKNIQIKLTLEMANNDRIQNF